MEVVYGGEGGVSEDGDGAVAASEEEVSGRGRVGEGELVRLQRLRQSGLDGRRGAGGDGDEEVILYPMPFPDAKSA